MSVEEERISRKPGDGSNSIEEDYIDSVNDGISDARSEARTWFKPSSRFEERLYRINEGERVNDGNRRTRERRAMRNRDVDAVATTLGLSDTQRERVKYVIERYDFDGIKFEHVLFATVKAVAEENQRDIEDESAWRMTVRSYGTSVERVRYHYNRLKESTDLV